MDYASKHFEVDCFIWKVNTVSRHIAEKLGRVFISEEPKMEQWFIDYGMELGAWKEEDISYICTYRIEKVCCLREIEESMGLRKR